MIKQDLVNQVDPINNVRLGAWERNYLLKGNYKIRLLKILQMI